MTELVVGIILTAVLGGLLVPVLKESLDRQSERFASQVELVNTLANGLWAYWKLALRVAYYGRQGSRGSEGYKVALQRWDGDDAWQLGCDIQIQVSRSKRLLSRAAQERLDRAQQEVVDYLDHEIERLRESGTSADWDELYTSLMREKRTEIDDLLTDVTLQLRLYRRDLRLWRLTIHTGDRAAAADTSGTREDAEQASLTAGSGS